MPLPPALDDRLALPLIAAPMTSVSSLELVIAACRNGVIGSFPTHNAGGDLRGWLDRIGAALEEPCDGPVAPWAANLIVHTSNPTREEDVAALVEHGAEVVITSVGSPAPVVAPLQDAGCLVFADVASMRHVERCLEAGVDGLVLLSAGAGGQTGWLNGLAFLRAVRRIYDGPVVLAGGIADGVALAAARVAGADLGYMGTRFIATHESGASGAYKQALVDSGPDQVLLTRELTGLPVHLLESSPHEKREQPTGGFEQETLLFYKDGWAAGHTVCGVAAVTDVASMVAATRTEHESVTLRDPA